MIKDERWILFVDTIFYVFLGVILLSLMHWQATVDAMSATELISYVTDLRFILKVGGLTLFTFCSGFFLLFCEIASFIIVSARSRLLGCVIFVLLSMLGLAWFVFVCGKADYMNNLSHTEKVVTYIVPKSRVKATNHENDNYYQLAVPKNKFVEKTTIKSTSGYTQIDGHTFEINGERFTINNKNNIIRHHAFGREVQRVTYTNYEWKKSVPWSVKEVYALNFGQLDDLDQIEIYE